MDNVLRRLAELERRLANVFLLGTIIDSDYARARVQVKSGALTTGWLPWVTMRAGGDVDYWAPEVGEQVVVMSPGGDPELGVVLPALYQNSTPATDTRPNVRRVRFADGADFSYDRSSNELNIVLPDGASTSIKSSGGLTITGDTTITGELHVTSDINSGAEIADKVRSMSSDRDIYNDHTHHPNTDAVQGTQ